ncbi:MAG: MotA/TolQ/ExbB proton channel family protein [Solirubrobacteraceae bacterium]
MLPLATDGIAEALAKIASALRTPVLVLALLALLVCAWEAGRFLTEYWARRRAGRGALHALLAATVASPQQAGMLSAKAPGKLAGRALLDIGHALGSGQSTEIEHALADYELGVQRTLDRTRILVRAGPALGLMGTLIPLAPGLAALGRGQVSTLATDLRTAFAATTIGLLVGTVAFAITLVRTRMYTEDLAALERAVAPATLEAPGATRGFQTAATTQPAASPPASAAPTQASRPPIPEVGP